MPYIPNEALTREQGEQIIDVLKGEEPKEYGYPYTNEVLNKEQGDRIIKAFKAFKDGIPAIGLPDPSTLSDGTVMVVVNGQWTEQEGYGYVESIFAPIKWDKNIEGKDKITVPESNFFYKISDEIFTAEEFTGATITISDTSQEEYSEDRAVNIGYHTDSIVVCWAETIGEAVISGSEGSYMGGLYSIPSDGTYFAVKNMSPLYVSALKSASTIHEFDPALIPTNSELPEVTTSDNGKFLRVVNGVWAASIVPNAGGNGF